MFMYVKVNISLTASSENHNGYTSATLRMGVFMESSPMQIESIICHL